LLGTLVVLVAHDFHCARRLLVAGAVKRDRVWVRWRAATMRALLKRVAPLGLMAVAGSLYQNTPRYFVEAQLGLESVGHFSAVFYFTYVGYTAVQALGNAAAPRLAVLRARGARASFVRLTLVASAVAFLIGLAGVAAAVLAGEWILRVLYTEEYEHLQSLFVWTMAGATLWYSATLLSYVAVAAGRLRSQGILSALTLAVVAVCCPLLIGSHGVVGAAFGLAIGLAVLLAGQILTVGSGVRGMVPAPVVEPNSGGPVLVS
jgi:O-antigen/teichoic acid export membrane protein